VFWPCRIQRVRVERQSRDVLCSKQPRGSTKNKEDMIQLK